MRVKFGQQLNMLSEEMTSMGRMIEKAIQDAIAAFFSQDTERAEEIIKEDILVDREQKKIEDICFQLLVQQQPVARDLRNITAATKMVTDMERIGDHAADISELTVMMADCPCLIKEEHLKRMADETVVMLLRALEAYAQRDIEKAREVISHDDIVDGLFLEVKTDLVEVMQTDPGYAEHAADLLMVDKYLERIGDHATNIAEWVIYSLDDDPEGENN